MTGVRTSTLAAYLDRIGVRAARAAHRAPGRGGVPAPATTSPVETRDRFPGV